MVKITKVYTKTGDQGQTSLAGNKRIAKNACRMAVIGDIDELNSHVGLVMELLKPIKKLHSVHEKCMRIQHELFNMGAQLAVLSEDRRTDTPIVRQQEIAQLENEIDVMNERLPTLTSFILPGGCEISAVLHIARTVCRRAERSMVDFSAMNQLDAEQLPYMNRLSDWLFVAARYVTYQLNEKEVLWNPKII